VEHEEFIQDHALSLEPAHNRLQKLPFICNDLVGDYTDDFCVQNSHLLAECQFEDRIDNDLMWNIVLMSIPSTVPLHSS
jgi:hypothetical protein